MRRSMMPGGGGAALLLVIALALRCWDFGNPVIHVDEQYYLLVGDRMLHGAVPYLDIWDRKPIGLFVLYAVIRLLPGDGVLAYQLVACLFSWATAMTIAAAARVIGARPRGCLAAGGLYLIGLSLLGGRGGQSPVFYNLPMAVAGLLTLRLTTLAVEGRIIAQGIVACLLAGIAIQIKYTPLFEGAFFGLAHLLFLRRGGASWVRVTGGALAFALAGLLPTLIAIGWYRAIGPAALNTWWFANITSIFLRSGYPIDQLGGRLLGIGAQLAPLAFTAVLSWRWRRRDDAAVPIALGWMIAALIGFLAIGTFFDHYALPLLAPLTVLAAPALGASSRALVADLGLALTLFAVERLTMQRDGPGARQVAGLVHANSGAACPYVFIGDTATYLLSGTCLPTRYAFPNLLAYSTERGATGIDEAGEVARILRARPPVIVTSDRRLSIWNPASLRLVKAALARDYRPVFSVRRNRWRTFVYLRRDRAFVR